MPLNLTDADESSKPGLRLVIASMFLYIEYSKPLFVSSCNVFVRCLRSSYFFRANSFPWRATCALYAVYAALGDVFFCCRRLRGGYSSWPRNIPSQAVNWLGSRLLHVTRNITRQ